MTLHGPPGLESFYHATRHFMLRNELGVKVLCCSPGVSSASLRRATLPTAFHVPALLPFVCCGVIGRGECRRGKGREGRGGGWAAALEGFRRVPPGVMPTTRESTSLDPMHAGKQVDPHPRDDHRVP